MSDPGLTEADGTGVVARGGTGRCYAAKRSLGIPSLDCRLSEIRYDLAALPVACRSLVLLGS